jgi:hypothetical protein
LRTKKKENKNMAEGSITDSIQGAAFGNDGAIVRFPGNDFDEIAGETGYNAPYNPVIPNNDVFVVHLDPVALINAYVFFFFFS